MADTYESADYRRSIGVERAMEESRILDKLNDWMSKHSPSVREIVEGDLDLTAIRRRVLRPIACAFRPGGIRI